MKKGCYGSGTDSFHTHAAQNCIMLFFFFLKVNE